MKGTSISDHNTQHNNNHKNNKSRPKNHGNHSLSHATTTTVQQHHATNSYVAEQPAKFVLMSNTHSPSAITTTATSATKSTNSTAGTATSTTSPTLPMFHGKWWDGTTLTYNLSSGAVVLC